MSSQPTRMPYLREMHVPCRIAPAASAYAIAGALNGMDKRIWIVQAVSIVSSTL